MSSIIDVHVVIESRIKEYVVQLPYMGMFVKVSMINIFSLSKVTSVVTPIILALRRSILDLCKQILTVSAMTSCMSYIIITM